MVSWAPGTRDTGRRAGAASTGPLLPTAPSQAEMTPELRWGNRGPGWEADCRDRGSEPAQTHVSLPTPRRAGRQPPQIVLRPRQHWTQASVALSRPACGYYSLRQPSYQEGPPIFARVNFKQSPIQRLQNKINETYNHKTTVLICIQSQCLWLKCLKCCPEPAGRRTASLTQGRSWGEIRTVRCHGRSDIRAHWGLIRDLVPRPPDHRHGGRTWRP